MHRRRDLDNSSLNNDSMGFSDKKKNNGNIFSNLISKRRKPKSNTDDDDERLPGRSSTSSTVPVSSFTFSKFNRDTKEDSDDAGRLNPPSSINSHRITPNSTAPAPVAPPRRHRRQVPAQQGPEVQPSVDQLQCTKPDIHSRTSSHSSGFEEGSSTQTETSLSDFSTSKELPKIAEGESRDRWREISSVKPEASDDSDFPIFTPESSMSLDEVFVEYFGSRLTRPVLSDSVDNAAIRSSGTKTQVVKDFVPNDKDISDRGMLETGGFQRTTWSATKDSNSHDQSKVNDHSVTCDKTVSEQTTEENFPTFVAGEDISDSINRKSQKDSSFYQLEEDDTASKYPAFDLLSYRGGKASKANVGRDRSSPILGSVVKKEFSGGDDYKDPLKIDARPGLYRANADENRSSKVSRVQSLISSTTSLPDASEFGSSSSVFSDIPMRSQMDTGIRGTPTKKKNVSFIAGNDEFGVPYYLKPHGIEEQLVLPFTEQHRPQIFPGRLESTVKNKPPLPKKPLLPNLVQKPLIPKTANQKESKNSVDYPERMTTTTRTNRVVRSHSDRKERSASEITGMFPVSGGTISQEDHPEEEITKSPRQDDDPMINCVYHKPGSVELKPDSVRDNFKDGRTESRHARSVSGYPRASGGDFDSGSPKVTPRTQRKHDHRYQSDTSAKDVESALEFAKKIEAFNTRLANMVVNAGAKKIPKSTRPDTTPGNDISADLRSPEGVTSSMEKPDGTYMSHTRDSPEVSALNSWKTSFPWEKVTGNVGVDSGRGISSISRHHSDVGDNTRDRYLNSISGRNRVTNENAETGSPDTEEGVSGERTTKAEPDVRLSNSSFDLHHPDSEIELPSRSPEAHGGSYSNLDSMWKSANALDRDPIRSNTRRETAPFDPRMRKSLQEQGADLQRQFSRWHRQLLTDKSALIHKGQVTDDDVNARQHDGLDKPSSFLNRSTPLYNISEREDDTGKGKQPVRSSWNSEYDVGSRKTFAKNQWDSYSHMDVVTPPDPRKDFLEDVRYEKTRTEKSLARSTSCVQSRTEFFPKAAMAKFNEDGTPKSILKKVPRSKSSTDILDNDTNGKEPEDDDKRKPINIDLDYDAYDPSTFSNSSPRLNFPSSPKRSPPSPCTGHVPTGASRDVSPTSSPSAASTPSSWSPDVNTSKFIALQNLQKRSAMLKKRSRSDLGPSASILDALDYSK